MNFECFEYLVIFIVNLFNFFKDFWV